MYYALRFSLNALHFYLNIRNPKAPGFVWPRASWASNWEVLTSSLNET
mgnify:CR=1 FL=1